MSRLDFFVLSTPLGLVVTVGRGERLARVLLGLPSLEAVQGQIEKLGNIPAQPRDWFPELHRRLAAYFQGRPVDFDAVRLWSPCWTPFRRRVVAACRKVPFGQVTTYRALAGAVGSPKSARAVGRVMRWNPWPLVVPCHRVLGAGGRLHGYSAAEGLKTKRWLLELEGVPLSPWAT